MIFGFNSEVRQGDRIYHVQSEARQAESRLETQIFLGGQWVGKHTQEFDRQVAATEQDVHELLKTQHRRVLDAIDGGRLHEFLAEPQIHLQWLSAQALPEQKLLIVRLRSNVKPVQARARLDAPGRPPQYSAAQAAADGTIEFHLPLEEFGPNTSVVVQASTETRSMARKFRLHKRDATT
jgi:hypothetical protein